MTSKLTREWLRQTIAELESVRDEIPFGIDTNSELELAAFRLALSCMESEPASDDGVFRPGDAVGVFNIGCETCPDYLVAWTVKGKNLPAGSYWIYTSPQPALEREQVRREHAEWSQTTFGDVGPVGPLKHLSKEALEAAADPGDLSDWADMQFLLWDAQRRTGITDEQITQAMIEKLAVNKKREWPAPEEEKPRLHIKK